LGILAPNNIGYEIVKGFEFGKTRSLAKLGYEILSLSGTFDEKSGRFHTKWVCRAAICRNQMKD